MWYLSISTVFLLHPLLSVQRAAHTTSMNVRSLGAGEQCGVYTLKCAPGLKCLAPKDDQTPLRTLLDGRGRCGNARNAVNETVPSQTTDAAPTAAPEEAPCRKRLNALLSALGHQLIRPQDGVYLPNCTRQGFYKKRQCWSSRGRKRGRCWCVDPNGTPLNSNSDSC
ncbi:insulin-like growth factor-binding protein 6 isoform X2 [Periophthalmus magnuspinnatus]|uniref:insulin-like growth factor-binding protein 6 isoform X2 n=1 Tax=Periophthalmus magnuspinnatus TaxID=409849 RepID=UPI002436C917|nr:insulin-like growth factor-binding protein 6 isoform X2 [Periophthalmus magnuspinnatus]